MCLSLEKLVEKQYGVNLGIVRLPHPLLLGASSALTRHLETIVSLHSTTPHCLPLIHLYSS